MALKGNSTWMLRSKSGRDKIYNSPEELAIQADEYFKWCLENPLEEEQAFHYQGIITKTNVSKLRPFTLTGLCNYIDIAVSTFQNYEKNNDFLAITTRIRQIIETQQFEGAASGFFQPNIIARKLGLMEKTDVTSNGEQIKIFELPSNGRESTGN